MSRYLVVYATRHSQSQKIAEFIAREIQNMGHAADTFQCSHRMDTSVQSYEGIIVGAPVYIGNYPASIRHWIKNNLNLLTQKPSAFFSVCLGVLQNDEAVQKELRHIVEKLLHQTKWQPTAWTIFAGAIRYSEYNWLIKFIMKRIAQKAGANTQTSQDYEYTNWADVLKFTKDFVRSVENSTLK